MKAIPAAISSFMDFWKVFPNTDHCRTKRSCWAAWEGRGGSYRHNSSPGRVSQTCEKPKPQQSTNTPLCRFLADRIIPSATLG